MKRILLVEDQTATRRVESDMLKLFGFDVIEATDANTAVMKAESEVPDMIIMDIKLSNGLEGVNAAIKIRENPVSSKIPIVFVTGFQNDENQQAALAVPNSEYLVKPFSLHSLKETIEKFGLSCP